MHPTHLLVRNVQVDLGWNASRLGLEVESMSRSCHINSPGGQLVTNHIVRRVPLKLQGKIFHTSLIILPTQKVDIILGMNWMEDQGVLLDTLSQSVHINSSPHGSMTLRLRDHGSLTHAVNQVEGKTLADIPVVCEYPDDLPGMPPDRNVEFAIELQPGTAPISQRPYRMPLNELAELKKQL